MHLTSQHCTASNSKLQLLPSTLMPKMLFIRTMYLNTTHVLRTPKFLSPARFSQPHLTAYLTSQLVPHLQGIQTQYMQTSMLNRKPPLSFICYSINGHPILLPLQAKDTGVCFAPIFISLPIYHHPPLKPS
jgi:hypothetical protein